MIKTKRERFTRCDCEGVSQPPTPFPVIAVGFRCAGVPQAGFADPTRAFADSLSLAPSDSEALLNLDAFLAFLSETAEPPAGINISRLSERRAVVRNVVSSLE